MRHEIKELTSNICGTEGVYEREDLVQEFLQCESDWEYAESLFQVAFHRSVMDHITDPPMREYDSLIEAFEKLEACCKRWQKTLKQ